MKLINKELMNKLKEEADADNSGMASAWGEDFGIIIFGNREFPINAIALMCAQAIIDGVLKGAWMQSSENAEVKVISPEPHRTQ